MRRLRWPTHERMLPKHPYRDSALIYAGLAVLVVVVALLTGASIVKAVIAAIAAFLVATLYSWWRLRSGNRTSR